MDIRAELGRVFLFVNVVRRGSFAAASRDLGLSSSLLSAAVSELEGNLGVRLLERTTRKLRLTQQGESFFARSERLMTDLEGALTDVKSSAGQAEGVLRITCTSVLVPGLVGPVLADLARSEGVVAELTADDQRRDLVSEGFDAGVRIGVPADTDIVARSIGTVRDVVVAAPSLVEAIDVTDFEAVRALPWIAHSALPRAFRLTGADGHERWLRIAPQLAVTTAEAQRTLLLSGAGATVAIGTLVRNDLQQGHVVRLLSQHELPALRVFVLLPSNRQIPKRTRLFVDALVARSKILANEG